MKSLLALGLAVFAVLAAVPAAQARPFHSDRFSVEVRGEGPDVILIPGLASSRHVYDATAARLVAAHRRVHLVQIGGFAGEPAGANAAGEVVAPVVEELARYISEQRLHRPAVIGHSLGGEAALMLAARHPGSVGRVMVVDALPWFSLLFGPDITMDAVRPRAEAFRAAMAAQTPEQFRASQAAGLAGLVANPEARARRAQESFASDPRVVAQAAYDLTVTDLRPELPRITTPVTVLYAWETRYGAPERVDTLFHAAYAGLPGVRLIRVDNTLHFIMDDQPARFAAEVDAFLAATPPR